MSHAKHRQIREIGEIRVRIKQRKIHVKKYSGYYFPSVSGPSANLVLFVFKKKLLFVFKIQNCCAARFRAAQP